LVKGLNYSKVKVQKLYHRNEDNLEFIEQFTV